MGGQGAATIDCSAASLKVSSSQVSGPPSPDVLLSSVERVSYCTDVKLALHELYPHREAYSLSANESAARHTAVGPDSREVRFYGSCA